MKRILCIFKHIVSITIAISVICGCTKDEGSISSHLILNSENNISFGSEEKGSRKIRFEASGDWTASSNAQWCKIFPASGKKGLNTIAVTVIENDTYDIREATVTIVVDNYSTIVNISQGQTDAILPVQNNYRLDAKSQTLEFKTSSNVEYTISTSAQWLKNSAAGTKGLVEKNLKFEVEENFSFSERNATITLKSEDITQEISVVQECYPKRVRIELLHTDISMEYPTFTGDESSAALAIWGDGTQDRFSYGGGRVHKYSSSNEKKTTFDFHGTDEVVIPAINSAKSITFYCD